MLMSTIVTIHPSLCTVGLSTIVARRVTPLPDPLHRKVDSCHLSSSMDTPPLSRVVAFSGPTVPLSRVEDIDLTELNFTLNELSLILILSPVHWTSMGCLVSCSLLR